MTHRMVVGSRVSAEAREIKDDAWVAAHFGEDLQESFSADESDESDEDGEPDVPRVYGNLSECVGHSAGTRWKVNWDLPQLAAERETLYLARQYQKVVLRLEKAGVGTEPEQPAGEEQDDAMFPDPEPEAVSPDDGAVHPDAPPTSTSITPTIDADTPIVDFKAEVLELLCTRAWWFDMKTKGTLKNNGLRYDEAKLVFENQLPTKVPAKWKG